MRRTWLILLIVLAAASAALPLLTRRELDWVDAVSGSRRSQTQWWFGWSAGPVTSESPLAARYRKLGLAWEPDWRNVRGDTLDVFGRCIERSHGPAPEIYTMADPQLQEWYLAAASDDEVRELFRVLSTGTKAEKEHAVDAAGDKALAWAGAPK